MIQSYSCILAPYIVHITYSDIRKPSDLDVYNLYSSQYIDNSCFIRFT